MPRSNSIHDRSVEDPFDAIMSNRRSFSTASRKQRFFEAVVTFGHYMLPGFPGTHDVDVSRQ